MPYADLLAVEPDGRIFVDNIQRLPRRLGAAQTGDAHVLLAVDDIALRIERLGQFVTYDGIHALERDIGLLGMHAKHVSAASEVGTERECCKPAFDAQGDSVQTQFVVCSERPLQYLPLGPCAARCMVILAPALGQRQTLDGIGGAQRLDRIIEHRDESVDMVALGLVTAPVKRRERLARIDIVGERPHAVDGIEISRLGSDVCGRLGG